MRRIEGLKLKNKIISLEKFENETCLLIRPSLKFAIEQAGAKIPIDGWFYRHVSRRIRFMYDNNKEWRKWLQNKNRKIDPRLQLQVWLRHWIAAYIKNPETYQKNAEGCFIEG